MLKLELAVAPYIGSPYLVDASKIDNTSTPSFDCWTFVHHMLTSHFDVVLSKNIFANADTFVEVWSKFEDYDYIRDMREWDIALFTLRGKFVDHCALVLWPEKVVHATPQQGVCIEPLDKYAHILFQIVRVSELH